MKEYKYYCDKCGKQIGFKKNGIYEIRVSFIRDDYFEKELCKDCLKNFRIMFDNFFK